MKSYTFSPKSRLKKRVDFIEIQSKGTKFRSRHLLLAFLPKSLVLFEKSEEAFRLGITVSKKIDKRAVRRNRLKRRIREVFRAEKHKLLGGADLVFIALRDACEINFKALRDEVIFLLQKGRFLPKTHNSLNAKN